tara:strand:- start:361 stop:681 length:321 start_codon:yes stop_codon:yes gene_type:complete
MLDKPNLKYLYTLSRGDKSFEKKLIAVLKSELPDEISTYKKNLSQSDFLQIAENVHKLKHKISILGLIESYEFALLYEEEVKVGNINQSKKFEEILAVMLQFVQKL